MEPSASFCLIHGDRPARGSLGACAYCADCLREIAAAARLAPPGVAPRECFATPFGAGGWHTLAGSGAAHWVAHELQLRPPRSQALCASGFASRRSDLLFGRRELSRELPRPGDLWIDLDDEGCGLVVTARRGDGAEVEISIRGLAGGAGGPSVRDFYRSLSGRGRFFR